MNNTTGHAHDATARLQLARRLQKQQLQQFSQLGNWPASSARWCICCSVSAGRQISIFARAACCIQRCRAGGALVDERLALFMPASNGRAR